MYINKSQLSFLAVNSVLVAGALFVFTPLLLNYFKGKSLGVRKKEDPFDSLVASKAEFIKGHYGPPKKVPDIETQIQKIIKEKLQYQFNEGKIKAFIFLISKDHAEYLNSAGLNFLIVLFIYFVFLEELKQKSFIFIAHVAQIIKCDPTILALAIQSKMAQEVHLFNPLKEDFLFAHHFHIEGKKEIEFKKAIYNIAAKEKLLWNKNLSSLFDELAPFINYIFLTTPLPPSKKMDIHTAKLILQLNDSTPLNDVKKRFKKLAQIYHPDKILSSKMPPYVERIASEKFKKFKEAYEFLEMHL